MATADVISSEDDGFEVQISKVKKEIGICFLQLMDCLKERERKLLYELEEILNTYRRERDKYKQSLTELEQVSHYTRDKMKSENLKGIQESIINLTTEKRKEFESQFESKHVSLDFDKTILELAGTIGRLTVTNSTSVVSSLPVVDYEGKVTPVLSIGGTSGGKEGQFYNPRGVAVHYKTGLLVYELNGTFLKQIGTPGNGEEQLKYAYGIPINDGDIFVCDFSNNRVQIFSKDFLFKSQFGKGILKSPSDIKLTKEYIYVLNHTNPFLYSFIYV